MSIAVEKAGAGVVVVDDLMINVVLQGDLFKF